MKFDKRVEQLIRIVNWYTGLDKLSLLKVSGMKYIEYVIHRDLIIYILIEEYPDKRKADYLQYFPVINKNNLGDITKRVHKRMFDNNEYIDLYRKIKYSKLFKYE